MAEYREIQGVPVESKTGSTGTSEGQIYYDSTSGTFKLVGSGGVETITTS